MNKKFRSYILLLKLDDRVLALRRVWHECLRRVAFRKPLVSIFLQIDDPYSYLLAHYLPFVMQRYQKVEFQFFVCQALRGDHMPEPALLAEYALADCKLLAREFGVPFLDKGDTPAIEYRRPLIEYLAGEQGEDDFGDTLIDAMTCYWRGDTEGVARLMGRTYGESAETNVLIGKNQLLLRKMGHYNCATMCYSGEWYWGVDRLLYLVERLDDLGFNRFDEPIPELQSLEQAMQSRLPAATPSRAKSLPALEYFHSFRSPYSYIGLQQAMDIADAFGLELRLRPILPMVMRALQVPKNKLNYIILDAKREARRHEVAFGRIADALGPGVERCMAAFLYAQTQKREREFVLEAGKAIFGDGIDVATDEGLQAVAERAGLFWPEMLAALESDAWRDEEKENRNALESVGLWGVPVLKFGDCALWGQDRCWLMSRQIEDQCHDGEGILE